MTDDDDDLLARLGAYGATLDEAADARAATDAASAPLGPDLADRGRRRRNAVRAVATVAATAAAAVGVLALATREADPGTVSDLPATSSTDTGAVSSAPAPVTTATTDSGPTTSTTTSTTSTTSTTPTSATPTSTTVAGPVAPTPRPCDLDEIRSDTGMELELLVGTCHAGWALAITPSCAAVTEGECEDAEAFHVTTDGWVSVGSVYPFCVDDLPGSTGMTVYTAAALGATVCDPSNGVDPSAPRATLSPGDASPEVRALQIALVFLGYDLVDDGEYGPATEAAVRDVQRRNGLPADGVAGPTTRAALEM